MAAVLCSLLSGAFISLLIREKSRPKTALTQTETQTKNRISAIYDIVTFVIIIRRKYPGNMLTSYDPNRDPNAERVIEQQMGSSFGTLHKKSPKQS